MRDALKLLELTEVKAAQAQYKTDFGIAQAWYNTIKRQTPTTRQEALDDFNYIKSLLESETHPIRLDVLREKIIQANEKFKEIKRNG